MEVQTGPGAHPASCTMGTASFPRVNYGRGALLTTHLLLVPRSWKSRAITLTIFWATTGPVTGALQLYLLTRWKWIFKDTSRPLYPPGKTRYPLYRKLGGTQGRSGRVRKISPTPGLNPRTFQLIVSRFTDCAIPANIS